MHYHYDADLEIQFLRPSLGFTVHDVLHLIQTEAAKPDFADRIAKPMLVDFRAARLLELDTAELVTIARARSQSQSEPSRNSLCCWVADEGSFGMLRMYSVYAEVTGLRQQSDFQITYDEADVLSWLQDHATPSALATAVALKAALDPNTATI